MQTPSKDDLIGKVPMLTREQFELRVINIETCYALAFESAKAMSVIDANARDIARQRRMNMMIETQICILEEETNITIAVSREERVGNIPFPPKVNHQQTMLNFANAR